MASKVPKTAVAKTMMGSSGRSLIDTRLEFLTVIDAIRDTLMEGEDVRLPGLGTFSFKFVKGKKARSGECFGKKFMRAANPDGIFLRFTAQIEFSKSIRNLIPKNLHRRDRERLIKHGYHPTT